MANTTQILKGLEIIEKYEPGTEFDAAHDQIWAGSEDLLFQMTEDEAKIMGEQGWFVDDDFGCWSHFA